jgi:hypothetical protein
MRLIEHRADDREVEIAASGDDAGDGLTEPRAGALVAHEALANRRASASARSIRATASAEHRSVVLRDGHAERIGGGCPLWPRKRTLGRGRGTSAMGH